MEELFRTIAAVLGLASVRILLAILLLYFVRFIAHRLIGNVMQRVVRGHRYGSKAEEEQREKTLTNVFRTLTTVILWVLFSVYLLQQLGVNLAALATGAGLLGIIVGFGAQSLVKDFLSGLFIILENQYRIGDVVTIAGQSGVVEEITIRMTKLRDLEQNVHFIPNGEVTTVTNMTLEYSGVVIDIGVSYDTDLTKAEKMINAVGEELANESAWEHFILEPIAFLRVERFSESSVDLRVIGKVVPMKQWDVAGEYRKRVKQAFDEAGIEIPLPQRVIHQPKAVKK